MLAYQLEVVFNPSRICIIAVKFTNDWGYAFFNFASREQAQNAVKRVNGMLETEALHWLDCLCGGDVDRYGVSSSKRFSGFSW